MRLTKEQITDRAELLAIIAKLESELYEAKVDLHKMYNERMDALNERFDQQRTREQAEAKAGCAALLGEIRARFSDLAVEMEKHSNDHIREDDPAERLGAAVEGVCADRINDILKKCVIPTDAAAALAEHDEQLRQKFSKECIRFHEEGHKCITCGCGDLAEEKRKAREAFRKEAVRQCWLDFDVPISQLDSSWLVAAIAARIQNL